MQEIEPEKQKTTIKENEMTLKERVEHIDEKLNMLTKFDKKSKRLRSTKIKSSVKAQLKKLAQKNKIMVIMLCQNTNIKVEVVNVHNGYINVNGVPRFIGEAYVYLWHGKYPCVIIQEWAVEPIGTKDFYDKNPSGLGPAATAKMLYAIMNSDENLAKKPINKKAIVIAALVVIALIWVLAGGSGGPQ